MHHLYTPLFICASLLIQHIVKAQDTLFHTGFETTPHPFVLNTTDADSQTGGSNTWLINNVFAGGSGDVLCLSFPIPYTIPATPAQPASISMANGNYLHTASTEAIADGILNCSFAAADGFCTDPGQHFAAMSEDINTSGHINTTLTFWWICNGGAQNYGQVYYSIDGGSSWTLITSPQAQYSGQSSWTQQTISLSQFNDQNTLRFGFRFVNNTSISGGSDPGFGVDEITVTGDPVNVDVPVHLDPSFILGRDDAGRFILSTEGRIHSITVTDMLGRTVNAGISHLAGDRATIDLRGAKAGTYVISAHTLNGAHGMRVLHTGDVPR